MTLEPLQLDHMGQFQFINQIIRQTWSLDEVLSRALDGLERVLGADRSGILLRDADGVVRWKAWRGLSQLYRDTFQASASWLTDATDVRTIVVPDLGAEPSLRPLRQASDSDGSNALAVVPLAYGGKLLGRLVLHFNQARTLTNDELQLAEAIAGQIALAIECKQVEEALRQVEEALKIARDDLARSLEELSQKQQEDALLARIGRIVTASMDLDEVYEQFTEAVRPFIPFDRLSILVVDLDEQTVTELYEAGDAIPGFAPGVVRPLRTSLLREVIGSKSGLLVQARDSHQTGDEWFPLDADFFAAGFRSNLVVPLMARNEVIGGLVFRSKRPDAYSSRQLLLAERVGQQISGAVANAQTYAVQKRVEERLARLQAITAALSGAATQKEVARVIIEQGVQALEASAAAVYLLSDDRKRLETVESLGYSLESLEQWQGCDIDDARPVPEAVQSGEPIWIRSREELATRYPDLASQEADLTGESWAVVPLHVEGRVLGVLRLSFAQPCDFTQEDRDFILSVAHQCAQALERARLYEAERRARDLAETAQDRLAFLAEASMVLSASLDYRKTFTNIAKLAVPKFADWCMVDVVDENGHVRRLAIEHVDPKKARLVRNILRRYSRVLDAQSGTRRVLRTGRPVYYPEVPEDMLRERVRNEEALRMLLDLRIRSVIIAPLMVRGKALGAVTFATAESGRRYEREDLALAEELARRASVAVENVRLYRTAQAVQEELRKANRAKDEFLGLISHEMRTPITTIYGVIRLLRSRWDQLDDESKKAVLEEMDRDADRLHLLVSDLLVLARLDSGQQAPVEPVILRHVLSQTVELVQERTQREIELRIEPGVPLLAGDPTYIEQVLKNILSNAVKYSAPGSPIEVRAQRVNEHEVQVSVLDRGIGIAPEEAEHIFEPFYRSERSTKHAPGVGLGLSVCKRLVEAMSGRIWARPRDGGGLEVSFTLPVYPESEDAL